MIEPVAPGQPTRLPPFPRGWYAVGFSEEFPPGAVVTRKLAGKEVVLYRTQSGAINAVDPICPHLGAHLGHGGSVVGETLRCPFHGFRFDRSGSCVATGYDTTPPRVRATTWPIEENHGVVLLHFDRDGGAPAFDIPKLDMTGFTPLRHKTYRLRGHPQDTTENSVDFGHLSVVHKYEQVKMIRDLELRGPYLTARYGMHRPVGLLGEGLGGITAEFEVHVHGLGYSFVEVLIPALGIETRNFVFATPAADMDLELRIAISLRHLDASPRLHRALGLVTKASAARLGIESLILRQAFRAYVHDVEQDFIIWKHKEFVPRPALALGDGPVLRYRRWAEQFYEPGELGRPGEGRARPVECS